MPDWMKTPWWRLPLTLTAVGVVVILLDIAVGLGWIPFLLGLAVLVYAAYRFARAEVDGGPRLLLAGCAGGIVLIAGLVWLHPQSWLQPGWTLPDSAGELVGRSGSIAVFADGDHYSGRELDGGDLLWEHTFSRPVSVVDSHLLVRSKTDPAKADAYLATNGEFDRVLRWRPSGKERNAEPTADQLARMPGLGSDEKVRDQVRGGADAARIVAAVDATGHHYTRLDVVAGKSFAQYRIHSAESLEFHDQVLVVRGDPTRVIPLIRNGS